MDTGFVGATGLVGPTVGEGDVIVGWTVVTVGWTVVVVLGTFVAAGFFGAVRTFPAGAGVAAGFAGAAVAAGFAGAAAAEGVASLDTSVGAGLGGTGSVGGIPM